MAVKILKSTIEKLGYDFPEAVEAYRQALMKHRFTVDEPRPTADPWIEQCIQRIQYPGEDKPDDFIASFEVVDDTPKPPPPPPPPSFEQQKDTIFAAISNAEAQLLNTISPRGKRRLLMQMKNDIAGKPKEAWTADEIAFMAKDDERVARMNRIQRRAAQMLADVEDLTDENIGEWKLGPFE